MPTVAEELKGTRTVKRQRIIDVIRRKLCCLRVYLGNVRYNKGAFKGEITSTVNDACYSGMKTDGLEKKKLDMS